jgi:hypothetical protein
MDRLRSKIQLKDFEVGEFSEISDRTLAETLALLFDFPWATERTLASVELNCPSVTLEHPSGSFLKIGPYFGGKFCLYYCSKNGKVRTKILEELVSATNYFTSFFKGNGVLEGFDSYQFVINPKRFFETSRFEYLPNSSAVLQYFKFDLIFFVIPVFLMMNQFFTNWSFFKNPYGVLGMIATVLLLMGPSIYLFFNYRSNWNNQYLRISRGHRYFLFGDANGTYEYDKNEIKEVCRYNNSRGRNPWSLSMVYTILFDDGKRILFSSLLIKDSAFSKKFPDVKIKSEHVFFPTISKVMSKFK